MKKKNKNLLILLITPLLILFFAYLGITILSPASVEDIDSITRGKRSNEVLFIPTSLEGELGDVYSVQIAFSPANKSEKNIKYLNLKIAYDPQNLKIREIKKGTASGIYQSSVLLDEDQDPVGLASLVWMPNEYGQGTTQDSIGELTVELLSSARQSLGITPMGSEGNLVNSSVLSITGEELSFVSDDLSINGGVYVHDEWLQNGPNACEGACSSEEVCLGGRCEKLAAATLGPADNVLGVSTDGMYACESDAECVKISSTCCGCDQGGQEIAINREFEIEYHASLSCSSRDYVCLEYNSCKESVARCISNVCQLGDKNVLGVSHEVIEGDFNGDRSVDLKDYSRMLSDMLLCEEGVVCSSETDLDQDGVVDLSDFLLFVDLFESK